MIVYGDPSVQESFRSRLKRLEESLSVARAPSLDARRALLIEAGILEQGAEDALPDPWPEGCRVLTDRLAEAFLDAWRGEPERGPFVVPRSTDAPTVLLDFKPPEGFAFYALYPEAYARSADRWFADHPNPGRVLVVGLRSIGTTLSAVVVASLRAGGGDARRLTLRPQGHPFHREATLDPRHLREAAWALVVDEGPGLSGSSMAAAAQALHDAGLSRERIAFLPGHGNEPGPQASEPTRAWWAAVPRVVTSTETLRWRGRTLEATLADRTAPPGEIERVEELTGGRWRALAYADERDWPPLDAPFERRKILVARTDGTALLWKFVSLVEPGSTLGFAPAPWIEGCPLTRESLAPDLLHALARHLAATAGPPLSEAEARAAHDRLDTMLRWNAQQSGIDLPEAGILPPGGGQGGGLFDRAPSRSALDDRLAPQEWRRLPDGAIVKVPRPHGGTDHTVVGRQPLEWAVAAALVEWNLDAERAGETPTLPSPKGEGLLSALQTQGVEIDPRALGFHRMAYAAFRLGMTLHCAGMAAPDERERLARAERRYRDALTDAVAASGPPTG